MRQLVIPHHSRSQQRKLAYLRGTLKALMTENPYTTAEYIGARRHNLIVPDTEREVLAAASITEARQLCTPSVTSTAT